MMMTHGNIAYPYFNPECKLQKGGSAMEQKVLFDWKSCVAIGATIIGVILVARMPVDNVGAAFNHLVNAAQDLTGAVKRIQ